jgi:hypothetical protein
MGKGVKPITFAGRPKTEIVVGEASVPEKDFEGREKLDKAARTIAGVTVRAINERAKKIEAATGYKHQYLVAQVIQLLSGNV